MHEKSTVIFFFNSLLHVMATKGGARNFVLLRYFSLHCLSWPKFGKRVLTNDKAFFLLSS